MSEDADRSPYRRPHLPFGLAGAPVAPVPGEPGEACGFAAAEYGRHARPEVRQTVEPPPREADEPPLSCDPVEIAAELALSGRDVAALLRVRRAFAFRNHPDRVAPRLREPAVRRMQIANALIDEALRGKAK